ncbi:TatD family hydrolase [uncultured Marinobacter sp.]|uniref:TatD family hydrolase n=1 Tax=uncultured Marinobacter sp. TaxID=187379 RepID=UPI0032B2FEA9|tara:strand:+ start:659 stop:1462 length:804 start_codon:yes stop_codon:yes gene_type:complete
MQLVDAHCHFDVPHFEGTRARELAKARTQGVVAIVLAGVRRADWDRVQSVAESLPGAWYCLGIHPWFVQEHEPGDLAILEQRLCRRPARCVGLGECGLDRLRGDLAEQEPWFEQQVVLATRLRLPLVIHSVKAHDQVAAVLRRRHWSGQALVHGFAGSYQQACRLVGLGCRIGVGGVITHPRAHKTRDAIARLPVDALVLETDAPDMAPAGVERGQNSPAQLPKILAALAELRGESAEALAPRLLDNACELYGWQRQDLGLPDDIGE